jgi:Ca-activated chloride channel family protein
VRAFLAGAAGDRRALGAFAGRARLVAPLTPDREALGALLDTMDPTLPLGGGTDLGAALEEAERALDSAGRGARVVVVTDGEDLAGRARLLAERLRRRGVRVDCVGVGTREGGKIALEGEGTPGFLVDRSGREVVSALSPETLVRVADAGGGRYLAADGDGFALRDLREPAAGPPGNERAPVRLLVLAALVLLSSDISLRRRAAA